MMARFLATMAVLIGLSLSPLSVCRAQDAGSGKAGPKLPRYKLRIGQELNYEGRNEFKYDRGKWFDKHTWQVLVVRMNADGGWRLLVRSAEAHGAQQKAIGDSTEEAGPAFGPEIVTLAWCDLTRDGRIADNPTLNFHADVRAILPLLPPDGDARSWQCENQITGNRHDYSLAAAAADPQHVMIEDQSITPLDEIYLSTKRSTFSFDVERGLVDHFETASTQNYGISGAGSGEITLKSIEQRDPNWCVAVALEMNDYFAVKQEYDELLERAGKDEARAKDLAEQARAIVEDLRKVATTRIIQDQLDKVLAGHERMAENAAEEVKRFAEIARKPSPAWETTDLDGSARSVEGCRGKVVVLDFWYRGCGWCIRAMPQMKQLATKFQGRPVEVFGMNTDSDEQDARFVVEKLALNYPTLRAEGIPEKYGVSGFPTLIILDQAGMVRDVHVGYSPTLAKSVAASVDRLLAEPAEAK